MTNNELIDLIEEELKRKNIPLDYNLEFVIQSEELVQKEINGSKVFDKEKQIKYKTVTQTNKFDSIAKQYNMYYQANKNKQKLWFMVNVLDKELDFKTTIL